LSQVLTMAAGLPAEVIMAGMRMFVSSTTRIQVCSNR
jgi:hypothetical protein